MKGTWRQEQAMQTASDGFTSLNISASPEGIEAAKALNDAIEVATTVKLTEDIIAAATAVSAASPKAALTAAFETAGFEVIA